MQQIKAQHSTAAVTARHGSAQKRSMLYRHYNSVPLDKDYTVLSTHSQSHWCCSAFVTQAAGVTDFVTKCPVKVR